MQKWHIFVCHVCDQKHAFSSFLRLHLRHFRRPKTTRTFCLMLFWLSRVFLTFLMKKVAEKWHFWAVLALPLAEMMGGIACWTLTPRKTMFLTLLRPEMIEKAPATFRHRKNTFLHHFWDFLAETWTETKTIRNSRFQIENTNWFWDLNLRVFGLRSNS